MKKVAILIGRESAEFEEFARKLSTEGADERGETPTAEGGARSIDGDRKTGADDGREAIVAKTVNYRNLAMCIDGEQTEVIEYESGRNLAEYDKLLVMMYPAGDVAKNALGALGCYARKRGIEMLDDEFEVASGKLYEMWRFWEKGIAVPKTAYGPTEYLVEKLERFGGVGVLKSTHGTKGRDNYLVKNGEEVRRILAENPEVTFILQEYVPNDQDWRIVTFDYQPVLAIWRSGADGDHRNNTSVGSKSGVTELAKVDPEILKMASTAAKSLNIRLAGADIMQNKETGEYVALEVNRTPQLISGSSVEEKLEKIRELVRG